LGFDPFPSTAIWKLYQNIASDKFSAKFHCPKIAPADSELAERAGNMYELDFREE
jgi:hypothetical protein